MPKSLDQILAANFKLLRKEHAGTQGVFADMLGLTQAQVSRLESGMSFSRMRKLGEALAAAGVEPIDLLGRDQALDYRRRAITRMLASADDETIDILLSIINMNADLRKRMTAAE